ncbi:MAG TPA: hypothetical protein DEO49_08680 [Sutterella sp.]|nr:hypothetical protein [Sutterella sp.]
MMRKSVLAAAVLGAFAGSVLAADVTLYGVVDTGLQFLHQKTRIQGDVVKTNSFSMESGRQAGSRWGLKGSEQPPAAQSRETAGSRV